MKSDLDRLMQKYNLDVIFILGGEEPSMPRSYLMNGAYGNGHVIKKRGAEPVAIVSPMEIDEAAKSGLKIHVPNDFGVIELRQRHMDELKQGKMDGFQSAYFASIFKTLGLSGRVGFYGTGDLAYFGWLMQTVLPNIPNVQAVFDHDAAELFQDAYETKDPNEIAKLKEAGRLCAEVVRATWDFIAQHHADSDGNVVDVNGQPLTIGAVKRFIRLQNLERGLENADGMIFAQSRDSAIPHSSGEDSQTLRTGQSIVFDYFPRLVEGGYFHDMTRTWSIGYATPELQSLYDQVFHAFNLVEDGLKIGVHGSQYQGMVNDYFEANGHPTGRTHPGTMDGYGHGLGHGLGLNIHEAPHMGNYPTGGALASGNVFTIEPGLYYPDRGIGCRIEDTVYFDQDGVLHHLTDFPYDLVLPLKG